MGLGFALEVAVLDELAVPLLQGLQDLVKGQALGHPLLGGLHGHVYLAPVLWTGEGQGSLSHSQGQGGFLHGNAQALGHLGHSRGFSRLLAELVRCLLGFAPQVPHAPGDPQGPAIPEQAAYLPQDDRHGVGGKFHPPGRVEVLRRFHKPHAPRLEQVVILHTPAQEPAGAQMRQAQVLLHRAAAGLPVTVWCQSIWSG